MTHGFSPETPEQVAQAVAEALSDDAPLEIAGKGARRALRRPVAASSVLDLSGLSGVSMYEPEELVFTAAAGTPLAEIESMLADKGQMLAFEPPDFSALLGSGEKDRGTIGGMTASGLSGPRRIRAGAVRDHLLGFAAVTGRAEIFKSGGRVMKNVTGYDLSKLMCGAWGTLAALTEVTFKALPAPETSATLRFSGLDDEAAARLMTTALRIPAEVSGAAHLPADVNNGEAATCIRLEGFAASVRARAEMLMAALESFGAPAVLEDAESRKLWRDIRDVTPFAGEQESFIWRISVPPAQGAQVAEDLRAMIEGSRLFMDWGGGLIWLKTPPAPHAHAELVRGALASHGGHATLFRAPMDIRRALPVFPPQPEPLALVSERIKAAFDPKDILNPGRVYPSRREG